MMTEEEKRIYTIDDIARELGVSKTTVSRAISGKGRIGQATRERVLAFIKEHDYRPNVVARGLAQRKTYNIALLMPKDYVATEFLFFKDCMNGICEVASEYNYDIIISMIENVSHFILGMIFGLSVYLFIRITIVSKKLDRLIRDINDTQNWIRKIQIDICDINKQWEVKRDRDRNRLSTIEDRIGKLASDFNDIIRKKV